MTQQHSTTAAKVQNTITLRFVLPTAAVVLGCCTWFVCLQAALATQRLL